MLRLTSLFILLSILTTLAASDFNHCQTEVKQAYKFSQDKHYYHTKYGWLVYSQHNVDNAKRSEPLLGLYLLKDDTPAKSLKVLNRYPKDVAAISFETVQPNHIINEGTGIDTLAALKEKTFDGAGIFGACCTLRGINTVKGVVTSDYMLRFLRDKKRFASAGIRIENLKGKNIVVDVNPFFAWNPFKKGDEILFFDGKKLSFDTLIKKILFSSVGSKHSFLVKRNKKKVKLAIFLKERLGGAILADTYLEHYGFRFNTKLEITNIKKMSIADTLGLNIGDKLISINNVEVKNGASVRNFLDRGIKTEKMRLLFERDGLQFSTYLQSNIMLTLYK